jgi:hypothetical protein
MQAALFFVLGSRPACAMRGLVMLVAELPSIHELGPLEQGGPIARTGFLYQDHVAARFCIDMLGSASLVGVWCETLDDITLLWLDEDGELTIEFVQVKSNDLGQMWSVAMLCEDGTASILAHSLAQHRCKEPCCFRIVTRVDVNDELSLLVLKRGHEDRCIGNEKARLLHQDIEKRLAGFCSPAGWSASAWLGHVYWDVAESESALENANLLSLDRWLEENGEPLFSDQRAELYSHILGRVVKASALMKEDAEDKKFDRDSYRAWVLDEVQRIRGHAPTKAGKILKRKMENAQIADSAIQNALELRLAYRQRVIQPKYQQEQDYRYADLELRATLQHLVAQLDAGLLVANGPTFHARCLEAAVGVRDQYTNVELSFLHGSMYSMTDRCRHRYLPAGLK